MKKIVAYRIVKAPDISILEEVVEKFMKEGWQPLGGMTPLSFTHLPPVVCQTIVLYVQE